MLLIAPGFAPRRYPLRRVSHLVLGGALEVEAAALSACLERRISLTFIAGSHELAGVALPAAGLSATDTQRLEAFLAIPDWRSRYQDWLRASSRAETLGTLEGMNPGTCDLRPAAIRERWTARFAGLSVSSRELDRWIAFEHTLLASRCALFMSRTGIDPAVLSAGPLLPPTDWLSVLGWRSYPDLDWLVRRLGASLVHFRQNWRLRLTEFAEVRAARDDRRIGETWARFLAFAAIEVRRTETHTSSNVIDPLVTAPSGGPER